MISRLLLLSLLPLVFTSPLERRNETLCGQFETTSTDSYSLLNNLWGESAALSGSQCSSLVDGTVAKWYTKWKWTSDSDTSIKSFANIQLDNGINKQLSAISTMPSHWHWGQKNTEPVVADVTYDLFTSYSAWGSNLHEVMIWLANFNAQPLSYNYDEYGKAVPIATNVAVGDYKWDLYLGSNDSNEVYSFLSAQGSITEFSGDIYQFFTYLIDNKYIESSEYLVTAQAGTEATSGSALFVTESYSLTIE